MLRLLGRSAAQLRLPARRPAAVRLAALSAGASIGLVAAWGGQHVRCEDSAEAEAAQRAAAEAGAYPPPPAKLADPEENAKILESWRSRIGEARERWAARDAEGAERALQQAVEEASHFGRSSGPVATSLLNLAQLYIRTGKLAEAEPLLVQAAEVLGDTAGPNHKVTLLALLDLAAVKARRDELRAAASVYDDALGRLDAAERNQPDGRDALREVRAGCLLKSARVCASLGELPLAEERLRASLGLAEERWGAASPRLLAPCTELARVLHALGRREESAALLARAAALPGLRPVQTQTLEAVVKDLGLAGEVRL